MVQRSILASLLLPALALCAPHPRHAQRHATSAVRRSTFASTAAPGEIHFINSCDYKVSVQEVGPSDCECSDGSEVEAGTSWNNTLRACSSGNRVLKVYKEGNTTPMQFEYGVRDGYLWYDMSFIDCIKEGHDFSACAGGGWAMGSEQKCTAFTCNGGEECCKQGYCDPYATGNAIQPNTGCGGDQGYTDSSTMGLTIELCGSH